MTLYTDLTSRSTRPDAWLARPGNIERKREYARKWRIENPDKKRAAQRKWREKKRSEAALIT